MFIPILISWTQQSEHGTVPNRYLENEKIKMNGKIKIRIAANYQMNLKPVFMWATPVRIDGMTQWYSVNKRQYKRITENYSATCSDDGMPIVCED
jgi:hypothetical protein